MDNFRQVLDTFVYMSPKMTQDALAYIMVNHREEYLNAVAYAMNEAANLARAEADMIPAEPVSSPF